MAKAKKLPSGNWRARVYVGKDANGKRIYESVTASTKKEAEYQAAAVRMNKAEQKAGKISFHDACRQFIDSRSNVISPNTLVEYTRMAEKDLSPLHRIYVCDITPATIQAFINSYAADHSPKTVRNLHGFICSVLSTAAPDLKLKTMLPQKRKTEIAIPTEQNIQAAVAGADDEMKAAILLASQLGMRRGEICALTWADVENNQISISKSLAKNVDKKWVVKPPKTTAGTRIIPSTPAVDHALSVLRKPSSKKTDRIFSKSPDAISRKWERMCDACGFDCRFHDLRHYNASVMLALGVPDKYAMARMGHATTNMLKTVYQHLQEDKNRAFNDKINAFFDEMHHEMHHDN